MTLEKDFYENLFLEISYRIMAKKGFSKFIKIFYFV
mgnify:CR=1 FL=1|jgi:hypothetical protein